VSFDLVILVPESWPTALGIGASDSGPQGCIGHIYGYLGGHHHGSKLVHISYRGMVQARFSQSVIHTMRPLNIYSQEPATFLFYIFVSSKLHAQSRRDPGSLAIYSLRSRHLLLSYSLRHILGIAPRRSYL